MAVCDIYNEYCRRCKLPQNLKQKKKLLNRTTQSEAFFNKIIFKGQYKIEIQKMLCSSNEEIWNTTCYFTNVNKTSQTYTLDARIRPDKSIDNLTVSCIFIQIRSIVQCSCEVNCAPYPLFKCKFDSILRSTNINTEYMRYI